MQKFLLTFFVALVNVCIMALPIKSIAQQALSLDVLQRIEKKVEEKYAASPRDKKSNYIHAKRKLIDTYGNNYIWCYADFCNQLEYKLSETELNEITATESAIPISPVDKPANENEALEALNKLQKKFFSIK